MRFRSICWELKEELGESRRMYVKSITYRPTDIALNTNGQRSMF